MAELDGKQVGTLQQDAVNKTGHQEKQSHNLFDLSHYNALTARFGDLTPFLAKEIVPGDNVRFGSNHELRTLTLSAPVLSPVRMHKDYFFVPMKAVLPHWDHIINNDVNASGEDGFLPRANLYALYKKVLDMGGDMFHAFETMPMVDIKARYIQLLCLIRNLFSTGSLLRLLQYPQCPMPMTLSDDPNLNEKTLDQLLTYWWQEVLNADNYDEVDPETEQPVYSNNFQFMLTTSEGQVPTVSIASGSPLHGDTLNSVGKMLDTFESINFNLDDDYIYLNTSDNVVFPEKIQAINLFIMQYFYAASDAIAGLALSSYDYNPECYVNPAKICAYHAIAAQFFTNDKIDDITNCRDYIEMYLNGTVTYSDHVPTAWASGPTADYFSRLVEALSWSRLTDSDFMKNYGRDWYRTLSFFRFDSALKYADYFMGSRPRPLAVGNVDIQVDGGRVHTIDVTKNLLAQKLLNAVNKLGTSISQYSKGIFGEAPLFVDATPQFLARSTTYIGNPETTNTAESQGKITSQFRSVDGKFEFNASFNDFGYIIGLVSFDVLPCYAQRVDRDCFHSDFYTFFNPMLQNIGDQAVNLNEVSDVANNVNERFAYQQRFAEYKSMASYCTGAFARLGRVSDYYGLQSWLFQVPQINSHINPYLIRHHRSDFDRFYSGFDGLGLADYCHFAIIFNNDLKINRKMQFQSTLL